MMIGMGLFWLALILGVVWLIRDGVQGRPQETPSENALTILDRRFAEGAVSLDEYQQRRDVLTGAAASSAAGTVTLLPSGERSER
jgi:uncharacterized membrane protein